MIFSTIYLILYTVYAVLENHKTAYKQCLVCMLYTDDDDDDWWQGIIKSTAANPKK